MKIVFIILSSLVTFSSWASVKIEVKWNDKLRKEIVLTCAYQDSTCRSLCQKDDVCVIEEKFCRDCIGTGLKMSHLINELGQTIKNDGRLVERNRVYDMIVEGNFVSLTPNDVYNVIDGTNSVRSLKKFEDLCPVGSQYQILLLSVDARSRKILRPEFVVCNYLQFSWTYGVTATPDLEINDFRTPALY